MTRPSWIAPCLFLVTLVLPASAQTRTGGRAVPFEHIAHGDVRLSFQRDAAAGQLRLRRLEQRGGDLGVLVERVTLLDDAEEWSLSMQRGIGAEMTF